MLYDEVILLPKKGGGELLAKEPWYSYDLQYERAWRHGHFMSPNEYTEWLLNKFPQWKGIFYYC